MNLSNGQKVKIIRLVRGWDQFELAYRCGIDRTTLSAFERNRRNSRKTLHKIEAAFGYGLTSPSVEAAFRILANDYADAASVKAALAILEHNNGA